MMLEIEYLSNDVSFHLVWPPARSAISTGKSLTLNPTPSNQTAKKPVTFRAVH
jgi:hypothetical protein